MTYTSIGSIPSIVASCRKAFNEGALREVKKRKYMLRQLAKMIKENESKFVDAVQKDICKCAFETKVTELAMINHEIYNALDNLDRWTAPQAVVREGIQKLDTAYVRRDPLGVVLIIGAWNYPFQLTLVGVVGAIAAGNTVVLKPSEVASNSAAVLGQLLPQYIPQEIVAVVEGAVAETTAVLRERFDHILYTGNSRVAKIIMSAAATHLTPVTLELGGKSPCIVERTANLTITARRIMWGRVINAGQSCIAPDYILVQPAIKEALITELKAARESMLGADPQKCSDYGRMINDFHYNRVVELMKGGRVVAGGEVDAATRYIAPTVLDDVDLGSPLMTEEIFGPLLPLIPYNTAEDAANFINQREKPLAIYVFSNDKRFVKEIEETTSSGALTVNDTMMHAAVAGLPFGGVGHSGMGGYHGHHTFNTFTHPKAVLKKPLALEAANALRYPPYSERKYSWLMFAIGRNAESKISNKALVVIISATLLTVILSVLGSRSMLKS